MKSLEGFFLEIIFGSFILPHIIVLFKSEQSKIAKCIDNLKLTLTLFNQNVKQWDNKRIEVLKTKEIVTKSVLARRKKNVSEKNSGADTATMKHGQWKPSYEFHASFVLILM